jgi:hypothetical protein|tara:strand:+ start:196 stop:828 length:633 start_codon:yes stop_codon:yes gene_type:complete
VRREQAHMDKVMENRMSQEHEIKYIPEGINFGMKMAIIPSVSMGFSHSGKMENRGRIHDYYAWIDRGKDLGRYTIQIEKTKIPILKLFLETEPRTAAIPSPVSGLLIHSEYDFDTKLTAILLPDDEPEPENGEYMFRMLCGLCRDYKYYFMKPSRYWSLGAMDDHSFNEMLEEQLSRRCEVVDAMPKYADYFNEIRAKHPNLRPYIRHLA